MPAALTRNTPKTCLKHASTPRLSCWSCRCLPTGTWPAGLLLVHTQHSRPSPTTRLRVLPTRERAPQSQHSSCDLKAAWISRPLVPERTVIAWEVSWEALPTALPGLAGPRGSRDAHEPGPVTGLGPRAERNRLQLQEAVAACLVPSAPSSALSLTPAQPPGTAPAHPPHRTTPRTNTAQQSEPTERTQPGPQRGAQRSPSRDSARDDGKPARHCQEQGTANDGAGVSIEEGVRFFSKYLKAKK